MLPLLLQDTIVYKEFVPDWLSSSDSAPKLLGALLEKRPQYKECKEMGCRS